MNPEDGIPLALYGVIVVLTAFGGIFGPPVVLLVAAGLGVLWGVMLGGHRRDSNNPNA